MSHRLSKTHRPHQSHRFHRALLHLPSPVPGRGSARDSLQHEQPAKPTPNMFAQYTENMWLELAFTFTLL